MIYSQTETSRSAKGCSVMNERFFVLTANRPFALRNAPGKGTRVWASAKVDTNEVGSATKNGHAWTGGG